MRERIKKGQHVYYFNPIFFPGCIRIRIGLATFGFPDLELVDAVRMCLRYSDHVHISPIYPEVSGGEVDELLELKRFFGADYSLHAPFPNASKIADVGDDGAVGLFMESAENAEKLGCDRMVIHSSTLDKKNIMYDNAMEISKACLKLGLQACFENRGDANAVLRDKESLIEFTQAVPEANLCFDTGHYFMWGGTLKDMAETITLLGDRIGMLHMVDTFPGQDAHMLPGYGEVSLRYLSEAFSSIPCFNTTPFIFEDQEPFEYEKGILNLRHALVSDKGMHDRNRD